MQSSLLAHQAAGQKVKPNSIQPGAAVPYVTPRGTSVTGNAGANSYAFSVRNSGTKTGVIYVSAVCSGTGVSGCSASPGSFSLSAGATRSVTVSYTGIAGGSGQVRLNASNDDGSQTDYGWINVTVPAPTPTYNVTVTPVAGSIAMEPGSTTATFTVKNNGNTAATYTLAPGCAGVATGCSAPASVTVAGNGGTSTVGVSFSATTRGGIGTVSLGASYGGYSGNGSVNVSVNNSYGVSVNPDGGSQQITPGAASATAEFTVTNTGSSSVTYTFSAFCGNTSCNVNQTSAPVDAGGSVDVSVDVVPPGSAFTVYLDANDLTHGTHDQGTVNFTTATYTVSVAALQQENWAEGNSASSVSFSVRNNGTGTATYALSASCSNTESGGGTGVIGCTWPTSVVVGSGATQNVVVPFTTQLPGDSAMIGLTASAAGTSGQASTKVRLYSRAVAVTPDGGQTVDVEPGSYPQSFSLHNVGNVGATYTLTATCTGVATACTPALSSMYVAEGETLPVNVTYSAQTRTQTGQVKLTATTGAFTDVGYVNVRVNDSYAVSVLPHGGAAAPVDGGSPGTASVTVKNTGTGTATYTLTPVCTGVASCPATLASKTLAGGDSVLVTVNYTNGAPGTTGRIVVHAVDASHPAMQDSGWVTTSVQTYTVSVAPHDTSLFYEAGTSGSQIFTMHNGGSASATYTLTTTCTGPITGCSGPSSLVVTSLATRADTVHYTVGTSGGTGTVRLKATAGTNSSVTADSGTVTLTPSIFAVSVAPQTPAATAAAYAAETRSFTVTNTGNTTRTFDFQAHCALPVASNCLTSPASYSIVAGASRAVNFSYTAGDPQATGTIRLIALDHEERSSDDSTMTLTVSTSIANSAVVVNELNPGTSIERSQCVIVSIVRDVADECGALRIVHPLPAVRTLGMARIPTLVYSSDQVQGPTLAVNIVLADTVRIPDWVVLNVFRTWPNGFQDTVPVSYPGSDWSVNRRRRVAVPAGAVSNDSTGILHYIVEVRLQNGDVFNLLAPAVSGELAVVSRTKSYFGAGWWLAGLEELYPKGDTAFWVGGDGSTRKYVKTGNDTVYVAAALSAPDTLFHRADGIYQRQAGNGLYVEFSNAGQHQRTVNRLGYVTKFDYDGSNRLIDIELPPWNGTTPAHTYVFKYADATGPVDSIIAPSVGGQARKVALLRNAGMRGVRAIEELLGNAIDSVTFGFQAVELNYAWRADRRNVRTTFVNEGSLPTIASFSTTADTAEVRHTFRTAASHGVGNSVSLDSVYSWYDGPRPDSVADTTKFWLDRFGAPLLIMNALGQTTRLSHGDVRFPTLVTEIRLNSGYTTWSAYDERGNLVRTTQVNPHDDGKDATITYKWHPKWNMVTKIIQPEKEVISFDYDSAGNRISQQDGRGPVSQVTFDYYTDAARYGLLHTVTQPGRSTSDLATAVETYDYESLGNLRSIQSPLGRTRTIGLDALGRVVRDSTRIQASPELWEVTTTDYDLADHVVHTARSGSTAAVSTIKTQETESDYDPEGNRTELRTGPWPGHAGGFLRRRWTYDSLGRVLTEAVEQDGHENLWLADTTWYDLAGNDTAHLARNGGRVRKSFDALNRLTRRMTSSVSAAQEAIGLASDATVSIVQDELRLPYPYYGNAGTGGGYVIPGEVATFAYDSASGMMSDANNAYAKIHRTLFPNGQMRDETTRVRTWLGDTTDASYTHAAVLTLAYDRNGRRTRMDYPLVLSPGASAATAQYAYDASTGALSGVTDLQGHVTQFQHDFRDAPVTTVLPGVPGPITDRKSFDDDGALSHWEAGYGATAVDVRDEDHVYDARGKDSVFTDRRHERQEINFYAGLGHLWRNMAYEFVGSPGAVINQTFYTTDPLGNLVSTRGTEGTYLNGGGGTSDSTMSRFDLVSGRLILSLEKGMSDDTLTQASADQPFISRYDASGNVTWRARYEFDQNQMQSEQRSYYAADQTLRATDVRYWDNTGREHMAFEEYAYDALGRRMGVRTRQFCYNLTETTARGVLPRVDCRVSTMRRVLWDGDAELGEIQMPGGDGEDLERDSLTLDYRDPTFPLSNIEPFFGRVAYVYAGALDQPLAVTRFGYQTLTQSGQTVQSQAVPTFTLYPLWNSRGVADNVSHLGAATPCQYTGTDYPSGAEPGARPSRACVRYDVADNVWLPYRRATGPKGAWHGSLVEDKRDASGLLYRRNRYYDPMTGRFTQEDPIGVAGGLNVYGFADGDPVTYSDPFGLCPGADGKDDGKGLCPEDLKRLEKRATSYVLGTLGGGGNAVAAEEAASSMLGARLATHLEQLEEYGAAGMRTLENGRIRYYGELKQAATKGEMIGRRLVREWDPATGLKRTWHETLDAAGTVRQVRPQLTERIHYLFDAAGKYVDKW